LEKLAATAPPQYPAYRAQVGWELGLANASLGRWGDAIRALNGSVATFEQIQEIGHASFVRELLAVRYERVGERRAAWRHRIAALRGMGLMESHRARVLLHGAATTSAASRDWPVTASFLRLELELPADGDDLLHAETLLDRARVLVRLGDPTGAASDLARATEMIKRLHDTTALERAEADRLAVEASLKRDPAQAVAAFTQAIEFHRLHGRRMFVPELLLERGRALKAAGKRREAAEDFETGITETERQHESLATTSAAWRVVAVGDDLFEEAIACAAERGDAAGAFAYAERSRAQAERSTVMPAISLASAVEGTKVVEYATLPDRVVIFVLDQGRVRLAERVIRKPDLMAEIEEVARTANGRDMKGFRRASSSLYASLVGPVAEDLRTAGKLTFVPDAALSMVPFGALLDGKGRYIIEDHAVVTVPSHAWCRRLSARRAPPDRSDPQLLLMQGPEASEGERLWSSQREADGVRGQYQLASIVVSDGGDRMEFEKRAAGADVIHFVGHSVMPDGSAGAALVTSRETGAAGRLEAGEIASMSFPRTRVVVLAACGTARDLQRPGDLSISVARAFLTAGVPSVVATLWPIDDTSAAEFFPRLHAHLARGRTAAEALRATQLEWVHREGASPGMWAAVQIIGN
jgi:CHAT domain-containing protein